MTNGLGMLSSRDNVLYLPFREGSGSTAYDYSGEGNDGTIVGATYKKIVDGGYALDFDGSSDYVSSNSVSNNDNSGSIAFWVKPDYVSSVNDILGWGATNSNNLYVRLRTGKTNDCIELLFYDESVLNKITGSTSLSITEFQHIVVISTGTEYKMFINGSEETITVNSGSNDGLWTNDISLNTFTIGGVRRDDNHLYFNGKIAYPMIFSRALSLPEIQAIYRATYIL